MVDKTISNINEAIKIIDFALKAVDCNKCEYFYDCDTSNPACEQAISALREKQKRVVTENVITTNSDKIRAMSNEELAKFIKSCVDDSNSHEIGCYECIYYGTHHSDLANKGTYLYECDGCEGEGIGLDVLAWLNAKYKEKKDG